MLQGKKRLVLALILKKIGQGKTKIKNLTNFTLFKSVKNVIYTFFIIIILLKAANSKLYVMKSRKTIISNSSQSSIKVGMLKNIYLAVVLAICSILFKINFLWKIFNKILICILR